MDRPETAPALRRALATSDREVAGRAIFVLDYFERRPIRELEAAIKAGAVDQFIDTLSIWPKGKHETAAWMGVCEMAHALVRLHNNDKKKKLDLVFSPSDRFNIADCIA